MGYLSTAEVRDLLLELKACTDAAGIPQDWVWWEMFALSQYRLANLAQEELTRLRLERIAEEQVERAKERARKDSEHIARAQIEAQRMERERKLRIREEMQAQIRRDLKKQRFVVLPPQDEVFEGTGNFSIASSELSDLRMSQFFEVEPWEIDAVRRAYLSAMQFSEDEHGKYH